MSEEYNPAIREQFEKDMLAAGKSAQEVKRTLDILDKAAKQAGISVLNFQKFDREVKKNTTTMGGLFTELVHNQQKYKDLRITLNSLENSIEDMEDAIEKANDSEKISLRIKQEQLIANRQHLQQVVKENEARKAGFDSLVGFGKVVGQVAGVAGKTMGGFAKGVQDGSSAFSLAGGLMEGAMDGMNSGAQAVGAGLGTTGTILSVSANPRLRALGLVAGITGGAIAALGDAAAATGKFIVGFLVKQLEQTVESFNKTSAVGAMFADGMNGMVNAAGEAGLTVKQFSSVLEKNSDDITKTGMSMADGAKKIGAVLSRGGDNMKNSMLKLGFGFEEQAGLVAETMATMKGSTVGPLGASNQQIAEQTQKYAENLRVVASITGEDARKKMDQVKQQASQLAFQQKLAAKSPEQQAAVMRAMSNMSEVERKNFMDMVNFGSVINKEGAVMQASSRGLADATAQSYRAWQDGTLDENKQRQISIDTAEQRKKDLLASTGIATAQAAGLGGVAGQVGDAMGKELQYLNKQTPEAIKAAEAAVKAQKDTNDKLTENTVFAANEAQKLAISLQKEVLPVLEKFAVLAKEILEKIAAQAKTYTGKNPDVATPPAKTPPIVPPMPGVDPEVVEAIVTELRKLIPQSGTQKPGPVVTPTPVPSSGPTPATPGPATPAAPGPATPATPGPATPAAPGPATPAVPAKPPAEVKTGSTKLTDFLKFGPGTGSESHFNKLDPAVRTKFIAMAQEYFAQTGKMLHVNSAFRTFEEQAALDSGKNPKAEPGKSLHNVGRALDINSPQVTDLVELGMLRKHGFTTLAGDPPHIQALDNGGEIKSGEVALVGEKGPELVSGSASVTSRSDTNELFKKMNGNLEAMLKVLKDQQSTSEKILWATG